MSDQVFPTLRGVEFLKRTPIWATKILESPAGTEQRACYQSTPRYKYTLKVVCLRTIPVNEAETLLAFFAAHRGRWDSFLFTDPYTNTLVRVRFDQDDLPMSRPSYDLWEASTITLISVK